MRISNAAFNKLDRKQTANLATFLRKNGLAGRFTKYQNFKDQLPLTTRKPIEMMTLDL